MLFVVVKEDPIIETVKIFCMMQIQRRRDGFGSRRK